MVAVEVAVTTAVVAKLPRSTAWALFAIATYLVNIACIVLMVLLLLHSCYVYGLLQEAHPSSSMGMNHPSMHVSGYPYATSMSNAPNHTSG